MVTNICANICGISRAALIVLEIFTVFLAPRLNAAILSAAYSASVVRHAGNNTIKVVQVVLGIVVVVVTTLMLFFVSAQLVVHFHKLLLQFKVNGQAALSCSGERAGANERDLSCAASNRLLLLLLRDNWMTLQCHHAPAWLAFLNHSLHCHMGCSGWQLSESSLLTFVQCRRKQEE